MTQRRGSIRCCQGWQATSAQPVPRLMNFRQPGQRGVISSFNALTLQPKRTIFLIAMGVENEAVLREGEVVFFGDSTLAFFNGIIDKLFDMTAIQTYDMIVMDTLIAFEHRLPTLKVVAHDQTRRLELGEHPIYRRQADGFTIIDQLFINIFRLEMNISLILQNIQDLHAGQRYL